jgi:hypothetical protein
VRSSSIRDPGAKFSSQSSGRKKKNPKERRGGLWKLPQPWKSSKEAFGDFFLMISTAA